MKTFNLAAAIFVWTFTLAALLYSATPAPAHDYKDPKFDQWVGTLTRPGVRGYFGGGASCCSLQDCHKTDAEYRNDGEWWARLGKPTYNPDGTTDWTLADWVKVPKDRIVVGPNGNPVPNQGGEALICHPLIWKSAGVLDPEHTEVFCFVPPFETSLRNPLYG